MKKILALLFSVMVIAQVAVAQDINSIIGELSQEENVVRQVIDKDMLQLAVAQSEEGSQANMPPFINRLDSIVTVILEDGSATLVEKVTKQLSQLKDENGFENLITVTDEDDFVKIIAKRDGDIISDIFVAVIDGEDNDMVIVKMSGKMTEEDLQEVINQQQKNN